MKKTTKVHSTNYFQTFIEVAEDSPSSTATVPPIKNEQKSIARMQFELMIENPYKWTSDDLLFHIYAERQGLAKEEKESARIQFFSKGQACLRASPLTKQYGWGIHFDENGKMALCGIESHAYQNFVQNALLKKVKAMRNKRK